MRRIFFARVLLVFSLGFISSLPVWAQEDPAVVSSDIPEESIGPADPDAAASSLGVMIDLLDLKNMEVLDVLKLISQKSGINIVASQNVKGRVTIYLKNIEALEALRLVVESYGWAYVQDGEIIKVMADAEFEAKYGFKFGQKVGTQLKQLLFARAPDVMAFLNQIKSNVGKIIADDKSNTLVLVDVPDKLEKMQAIIREIDVPTKSEVFDLSYAKASEISEKITEMLTPNVGRMKSDERSNKIVISDTAHKLKEIRKMIEAFDQRNREVLIEAKILQVVLNDEYKMGIDWEAIVSGYHQLNLVGDFDILTANDKRGKMSIGTLSEDDFTVLIEALDTVGVSDILSNPRITALNNQEAKILVGSTEPYVTSSTTSSDVSTITAESVEFVEVGVKLYVTPTIHHDDFITMKIKPEVSSKTGTITTGSNNTIPIIETSEAETMVTVKDGVTIVIGGLIKEEKIKSTKKVPLIGDIPVLGFAFRSVSDQVKKTETVIFLKPRIITGDAESDRLTSVY